MEAKAIIEELAQKVKKFLPKRGSPSAYVVAIALTAIALWVRLAMAPVQGGLQYVTFFPAITLAAAIGGLGPGVLTTVIGASLASFIFTPPYFTVSLLNLQTSFWSNLVFMIDGLIVCSAFEAIYHYQQKYFSELIEVRMNAIRIAGINQALKDSEAFTQSIFDSRTEQVAVLDEQGVIIAVNKAWRDFAAENGATTSNRDSVGMNYIEVCKSAANQPEASEASAVAAGIEATIQGTLYEFEIEYACHSPNEERWFKLRITPLQGSRHGVVVAHENISRRKAMEETLLLHKAIIDASEDAIIGKTRDGMITSWNTGAEQTFGYTREEALGKHISLIVPESLRDEEERILGDLRQGKFLRHYETLRIRKDGQPVNVSVAISPLRDGSGKVIGASSVARDITHQKQAEQELRIAATAFEAQEGMMVTDARKFILRVNRAFTLNSGYTAEEVVGKHVSLLRSGRHSKSFYAEMWQAINQMGAWQGEIWNRRKNGEIYPEWLTVTAVKNAAGKTTHYVGTHTDITSRKAAEDEIKHLAFYDPLTRLPNRRLLMDRLHQALSTANRMQREVALMFIDMDNFKHLNDTLGHDMGDLLLQEVARRASDCIREGDTVARLGGDEFIVMLELLSQDPLEAWAQAGHIGEKMLAALNQPYILDKHEFQSTPSIGITLFGHRDHTGQELIKEADAAMYEAKKAGRNCIRLYRAPESAS